MPVDPAVAESLWIATLAGVAPGDVVLVGVIPAHIAAGAPGPDRGLVARLTPASATR